MVWKYWYFRSRKVILIRTRAGGVMETERPVTQRADATTQVDAQADKGEFSPARRRAIPATCELHRGSVGYTNLIVRKGDGNIVLDPHAVGCCVIRLDEAGASALRDTLMEWLG
jgi:hypothetical protein